MPHYLNPASRAIIRPMNRNRLISLTVGALSLAAMAALVLYLAIPGPTRTMPPELSQILLPEARELAPFSLTDMEGEQFDLARLKGKWSFIFFGYTHCPDICPTTLSTLKGTAKLLQKHAGNLTDIQFVFVSVDPKRDTPVHLKQYISYFHPDFLAATGGKNQIDELARQLGAIYMFDGDTAGEDYLVNHSATILLIDPQARWVGRFNPPHSATGIVADFQRTRDFLNN